MPPVPSALSAHPLVEPGRFTAPGPWTWSRQHRNAWPLGKRRLAERKTRIEGTFGLAKELHGLRRTRFRGRRWVQIQLWLTAAAMNIKRAVRNSTRMGRPVAPARLLAHLFVTLIRRPLLGRLSFAQA